MDGFGLYGISSTQSDYIGLKLFSLLVRPMACINNKPSCR